MIKKLLITGLTTFLLAGCTHANNQKEPLNQVTQSQTQLDKKYFIGEWGCDISYHDLGLSNLEHIKLNQDNSINNTAILLYHIDNKSMLRYRIISEGTWTFKDNKLIYKIIPKKVTKEHSKLVQKKLKSPKGADKEKFTILRKIDEGFFYFLKNPKNYQEPFEFDIPEFDSSSFRVIQEASYNKRWGYRGGACGTPKDLKKILEILNINFYYLNL